MEVEIFISIPITNDFTALHVHGMQTRYSDEKGVRLSVCPSVCLCVCLSVKRMHCDETEEGSVQIFIPYERLFSLVFTALHVMQTRYSDENSVRLSVCPSVCPSVRHTRDP